MTLRNASINTAFITLILACPSLAAMNSDDPKPAEEKPSSSKKPALATFGGGCFWCLEAVFERIPGVLNVVSGYSGGSVPNPSYDEVLTGQTGHAEVVQISYDPQLVSYDHLLDVFWACHDPTSLNRQGPDFGTQYRSVIFFHDDKQRDLATASAKELKASKKFRSPIVTQLIPVEAFYPAEAYHQDYYRKHPNAPYCRVYIAPKVRKIKAH